MLKVLIVEDSMDDVLLVIVVLVLLFLFRDQLGFGTSKTEVSIPDKIEVNVN